MPFDRHAVRPGGNIVFKNTYQGSLEVDISALVVDEIRLVRLRCGPFPAALRLLEHPSPGGPAAAD